MPHEKRHEAERILRGYSAHIAALDTCFDRLLQTLERLNIANDTILIFSSDHGDMMLSQSITTKLYPWDESIRVPFLLRYPARFGRRERHVHTPISQPDILPTLLSLAGLPVPDGVQGRDYSQLIDRHEANAPQPHHNALLSLPVPITEARRYGFAEYRGLRTDRHTYVRSLHGPWLLYDNSTDPYQMHNLVGRSGQRRLLRELDASLHARLREIGDEFLPSSEYVRQANLGHYKEVNEPIGHTRSPWGDWESTL